MSEASNARRLDLQPFARAGAELAGREPLQAYPRLLEVAAGPTPGREVQWQARGEWRPEPGGGAQVWLHLQAQVVLPLICQRCLEPAEVTVQVQRSFRFVATEAQAAELDEQIEEDVLVLAHDFDLHQLVEDELLLALPLVPRHGVCPFAPPLSVQDVDFEAAQAERPNPFAALRRLKGGGPPRH
jgi:uncharacterized protein